MANELTSQLKTEITADSSKFLTAVNQAQRAAGSFSVGAVKGFGLVGSALAGIGTAIAGIGFAAILQKGIDGIGKLADQADKLGVSASKLQGLQLAASEAGVSGEELSGSMQKLSANIGKISTGNNDKAADLIKQLGVNFDDLKQLKPEEQYLAIADAIGKLGSQSDKAYAAQTLLGKGANTAFLSSDIAGTVQEYKDLGAVLSDLDVAKLDKLGDTQARVGNLFSGFGQQLAVALSGPLQEFYDFLIKTIKEFGGLDTIAKTVSDTLVSGFRAVGNAIGESYKFLQSFKAKLAETEVNYLDNQERSSRPSLGSVNRYTMFGGLANSEVGASYMPGIDYTRQRAKLSGSQNDAEIRASGGSVGLGPSSIPSIVGKLGESSDKAAQSITQLSETAKNVSNIFDGFKPQGFEKLLSDINAGDPNADLADEEDFVQEAQDILASFRENGYSSKLGQDAGSLIQKANFNGITGDNAAQLQIARQLQEYITKGQDKAKVDLNIKLADGLITDGMATVEGSQVIDVAIEKYAAKQARKVSK